MTATTINLGHVITAREITSANYNRTIKIMWAADPMRDPLVGTLTRVTNHGPWVLVCIDGYVGVKLAPDALVVVQ